MAKQALIVTVRTKTACIRKLAGRNFAQIPRTLRNTGGHAEAHSGALQGQTPRAALRGMFQDKGVLPHLQEAAVS